MQEQRNIKNSHEGSPGLFTKKIEGEHFTCDFVGVYHNRHTIEKSGELLKQIIADSEVLVTELAVFDQDSGGDGITYFYSHITELAKEAKIKMIVPDPEKDIIDALTNRFADLLNVSAAVGSTSYAFVKIDQIAAAKNRSSVRSKRRENETLSRRNFLKASVAVAVAIPTLLNSAGSLLTESGVSLEDSPILEDFLLESIDYRNVCIAKAILEVSKIHPKITVVYGANHYEGVKHYLHDEQLLAERLSIYEKTFGIWSPDKVEEFDFS